MPGVRIVAEELHGTFFGFAYLTNEVRFSLAEEISTPLGKGPMEYPSRDRRASCQ
jgi:hypothetical protein